MYVSIVQVEEWKDRRQVVSTEEDSRQFVQRKRAGKTDWLELSNDWKVPVHATWKAPQARGHPRARVVV